MKRGIQYVDDVAGTADPSSSNDVEAAIQAALNHGAYIRPRMPWETTPLMRQVFGGSPVPWLHPLKVPRSFPAVNADVVARDQLCLAEKKIIIRERSYAQVGKSRDIARDRVLLKWLEVLLLCPYASRVGRQLDKEILRVVPEGKHLQIISDSLQGKSTRTLDLRVSSLLLYIKWHDTVNPDETFLPFNEPCIYNYLCDIRDKACSASRGTTFISTLAFCKDVLGMEGAIGCIESTRVSGAALSMYLTKRPLKQAPPLEAHMIAVLEIAAFCECNPYLRCLAGFCLCCIYGRMRVSDMNRIVNMSIRGGFAECSLMKVKTARTKEKQTAFLPSVIPGKGLTGLEWFRAFCFSRAVLGLGEFPSLDMNEYNEDFVVLPSKSSCHLSNQEKISTSEVTDMLKIILGKIYPAAVVSRITSHSLKTTILTYLGVMGCDYTYTELLGYHLTQHRSAINYQRQALAAPIRYMCDMLQQIRSGVFVPLAPRDKVFPEDGDQKAVVTSLEESTGLSLEQVVETFLGTTTDEVESGNCREDIKELWRRMQPSKEPFVFESPAGVICVDGDERDDHSSSGSSSSSPSAPKPDDGCRSNDEDVSIQNIPEDEATDSCSSSAESALAGLVEGSRVGLKMQSEKAIDEIMYRHQRTKMLHMGHIDAADKTACGRHIGQNYDRFYGDADKSWPHCAHCFGNL